MFKHLQFIRWILAGILSLARTITIPLMDKVDKWIADIIVAVTEKTYKELAGKVVVITGASSGLGEALSYQFMKHGCQIVLCARRRQELEKVRMELQYTYALTRITMYDPIIIQLDLSDINALRAVIDEILVKTGHIDILVNNGGISHRGKRFNKAAYLKQLSIIKHGANSLF